MAQVGEECEHARISRGLDWLDERASAVQREQGNNGLSPEPAPRQDDAVPNDVRREVLDEIADECLALRVRQQMMEQPERETRRRRGTVGAHGVPSPRSRPRAIRRSTSTDWRTERRPAAVTV